MVRWRASMLRFRIRVAVMSRVQPFLLYEVFLCVVRWLRFQATRVIGILVSLAFCILYNVINPLPCGKITLRTDLAEQCPERFFHLSHRYQLYL